MKSPPGVISAGRKGSFVWMMLSIWRRRTHLIEGQLQLSRLLRPGQNQLSAGVVQVQIIHIHTHFYHVLHCLYTARTKGGEDS